VFSAVVLSAISEGRNFLSIFYSSGEFFLDFLKVIITANLASFTIC